MSADGGRDGQARPEMPNKTLAFEPPSYTAALSLVKDGVRRRLSNFPNTLAILDTSSDHDGLRDQCSIRKTLSDFAAQYILSSTLEHFLPVLYAGLIEH